MEKTRRGLIASLGIASFAGCLGDNTEENWLSEDEFPADDDRNRECNIKSPGPYTETITPTPGTPGYQPFAFTISGREDLHGTNQHFEIDLEANQEVDIYITPDTNAAIEHVKEIHENEESQTETDPESEQKEDVDLRGVNQINDLTETGVTKYERKLQVPDGESYTVLTIPHNRDDFSTQITVSAELECSFFMTLDEYEERI